MADVPSDDVTRLLARWKEGDEAALQQLVPIVHEELRRVAQRQMAGEGPGHTLQPTALVNETYPGWSISSRCNGRTAPIFLRWLPD